MRSTSTGRRKGCLGIVYGQIAAATRLTAAARLVAALTTFCYSAANLILIIVIAKHIFIEFVKNIQSYHLTYNLLTNRIII